MIVMPEPISFCTPVPSFENEKLWFATELMAHLVNDIIDIKNYLPWEIASAGEVIPLPLLASLTDAADAARISAAA